MMAVPILEALEVAWKANVPLSGTSSSAGLVPGGLVYDRAPKPDASPYGVVKIAEGTKEENSSATYVQTYMLGIRVWGANGTTTHKQIAAAMDGLLTQQRERLAVTGARVLAIYPKPDALETDPAVKSGEDVLITTGAWEIMLQITRS